MTIIIDINSIIQVLSKYYMPFFSTLIYYPSYADN